MSGPAIIPFEDLDPLAKGNVLQDLEKRRRLPGCGSCGAYIFLFILAMFASHCVHAEPIDNQNKIEQK